MLLCTIHTCEKFKCDDDHVYVAYLHYDEICKPCDKHKR